MSKVKDHPSSAKTQSKAPTKVDLGPMVASAVNKLSEDVKALQIPYLNVKAQLDRANDRLNGILEGQCLAAGVDPSLYVLSPDGNSLIKKK